MCNRAPSVPLLTTRHKLQRLRFARNRTFNVWKSVLFTGETWVWLRYTDYHNRICCGKPCSACNVTQHLSIWHNLPHKTNTHNSNIYLFLLLLVFPFLLFFLGFIAYECESSHQVNLYSLIFSQNFTPSLFFLWRGLFNLYVEYSPHIWRYVFHITTLFKRMESMVFHVINSFALQPLFDSKYFY